MRKSTYCTIAERYIKSTILILPLSRAVISINPLLASFGRMILKDSLRVISGCACVGSVFTGFGLFKTARALESKQTWVRIRSQHSLLVLHRASDRTPLSPGSTICKMGMSPPASYSRATLPSAFPVGSVYKPWESGEWLNLGVCRLVQRRAVVVQDATERMDDEQTALDPSARGALISAPRL